jgi:peptide/nickel transport system substrate-binding protein
MNPSRYLSVRRQLLSCLLLAASLHAVAAQAPDFLRTTSEPGRMGGKLVIAQRSEPRTLNPVTAVDQVALGILDRMMADLIHINRQTQKTEPALAKSWTMSKNRDRITMHLRQGIRFSDGAPFDADDVLFSFKVYEDEQVHSPRRDALVVAAKPITVEKLDSYTVRFTFPGPYAPAERVFDSIAILPRHLLENDYREGKINQLWGLNVTPDRIAGLGPFRLKQVVPGDRMLLERNPYYWKVDSKGQKLPYMDELTFLVVPNQDAQVIRFQAGDSQIIASLSADNFAALEPEQQKRGYKLYDAGPGLEYNFLMFNLNDDTAGRLPDVARKQKWFRDVHFRQAVSLAIDRDAIVRLVYHQRGVPLAAHVSPGNKLWFNTALPAPVRSVSKAKEHLQAAGFKWNRDGTLLDTEGKPVEFTIIVSSSNSQRTQMATLVQDDLKQIGITAHVVALEPRAAADRLLKSHDYDTILMGLVPGDADPSPDVNIWLSSGETHLWNMGEKKPATQWEAEIDELLQKQFVALNYQQRKKLYDRLQTVEAEQLPIICLASPNILVGAQENLGNFRPAILEQYTFWNVEELFWRTPAGKH